VLVPQVMEAFTSFYPHTNAIFLKPKNTDLVIKRLRSRGDSEQQINERLKHTLSETAMYEQVKHLYRAVFTVTESNFNELVTAILKITNPNAD
jgi:guanylate kinase